MTKQYVQYGCGLSAPKEWINFDASPNVWLQRLPLIGNFIRSQSITKFPENVQYGDIVKGLSIHDHSCDGVYCSHVLEHLSLSDFRTALINTRRLLKKGGIFRCVLPDLEFAANAYLAELGKGRPEASSEFMKNTSLGTTDIPKGLLGKARSLYSHAKHLWMWDALSLEQELKGTGFEDIRKASFNDCDDPAFMLVEDEDRFRYSISFECREK